MPRRPPNICAQPGCNQLTNNTRCPNHTRADARQVQAHIYKTKRWQALRRQVLREHPLCEYPHCPLPATPVDHIIPLRDGGQPYDRANLQALCTQHHNAKTARETRGI